MVRPRIEKLIRRYITSTVVFVLFDLCQIDTQTDKQLTYFNSDLLRSLCILVPEYSNGDILHQPEGVLVILSETSVQ